MKARWFPLASLLLLSLALLAIRWLTYFEPLERDMTIYAVVAHGMLEGRPLYSEMWDIKPPGVYLLYAAAELLAGYGRNQIFLLGVGAGIATLFGIYKAVLELTEETGAALWAAAFWVLVCSDIDLLANQPNAEVFMNAAVAWGLFWFFRAWKKTPDKTGPLWAAGCCWALASYVKQVAFMVPLLLGLYWLFAQPSLPWKKRGAGIVALWLPTVAIWALTVAYFAATGRFDILVFSLVKFGTAYVGQGTQFSSAVSYWSLLAPKELVCLSPLVLLIWLALVATRNGLSKNWILAGICGVATQIAISLPGYYHMHYYQLWLPQICWVGGLALAEIGRLNGKKAIGNWLGGAALLGLLALQVPKWGLTPNQVSVRKYGSPLFVDLAAMAPRLDALLKPNETFYQYGYDPEFYFITGRRPPVGVLSLGAPDLKLPNWFEDRILADLRKTEPDLALVNTGFEPSRISNYLLSHYTPLPRKKSNKQFLLVARRGSEVEGRLKKMTGVTWP